MSHSNVAVISIQDFLIGVGKDKGKHRVYGALVSQMLQKRICMMLRASENALDLRKGATMPGILPEEWVTPLSLKEEKKLCSAIHAPCIADLHHSHLNPVAQVVPECRGFSEPSARVMGIKNQLLKVNTIGANLSA
ncbi:hypothetical protein SCA6_011593 [Theobroma cacao]